MPPQQKTNPVVRDLTIIGDFLKYFLCLFFPFALLGLVYCLVYSFSFMAIMGHPVIYAGGITSIIIVIKYDINELMALFGRAKEPAMALHIKHFTAIQQISVDMSSRRYNDALGTVSKVLQESPDYPNALNLKGQILLEGFRDYERARACFARVMQLCNPDSDDYRLAEALAAAITPRQ